MKLSSFVQLDNEMASKRALLGDLATVIEQNRMRFKPIKSRLSCWTGGQEQ